MDDNIQARLMLTAQDGPWYFDLLKVQFIQVLIHKSRFGLRALIDI